MERSSTNVEKALSRLGVSFGWQEGDLFLFDTGRIADGEDMPVRMVIRENSLQLTTPVYEGLSSEQVSVIVWQEWKRRGEPTFLLLPETDDHPLLVASRIPRLPKKEERPRDLARIIAVAIRAMARSREKIGTLLDEVLLYENDL